MSEYTSVVGRCLNINAKTIHYSELIALGVKPAAALELLAFSAFLMDKAEKRIGATVRFADVRALYDDRARASVAAVTPDISTL